MQSEINHDLWIVADRDHLWTIITNLLDYPIKYSPQNSTVNVNARVALKSDSIEINKYPVEQIVISVSDTGRGIPQKKLNTIFERFERIKAEKSDREKGLGLGLHIVKKLVELMGGKIWVESEVNKGSTFSFTLKKFNII